MPLKAWPSISPISSLRLTWAEAGFGSRAHVRRRLRRPVPAGLSQASAGQWVTGFAEQAHRSEAHGRVGVHQLQIGQRQAEGGVNAFVFFAGAVAGRGISAARVWRFSAVAAQRPGGFWRRRRADLMAGQGGVDQAPQAVIQARGFSGWPSTGQHPLLQGVDQLDTRRIGLRAPRLPAVLPAARGWRRRSLSAIAGEVRPCGSNSAMARIRR